MRTEAVPGYPAALENGRAGGARLAVGEIRTGLLRNSSALPKSTVAQLVE